MRQILIRAIARVVTELFAPAVLIALMLVALGWYTAEDWTTGLFHGAIAALFESLLPFAYIVRAVRAGQLSDHHVGVRSQRRRPLSIALGSVAVGLVILLGLGAARPLIAAVVAGGAGLIASICVSHWWKMSIHTAVASGAFIIMAILMERPWLYLATLPLVALVGWSRVRLYDHTVAQVVVGTVVGAMVAGSVFGLLAH